MPTLRTHPPAPPPSHARGSSRSSCSRRARRASSSRSARPTGRRSSSRRTPMPTGRRGWRRSWPSSPRSGTVLASAATTSWAAGGQTGGAGGSTSQLPPSTGTPSSPSPQARLPVRSALSRSRDLRVASRPTGSLRAPHRTEPSKREDGLLGDTRPGHRGRTLLRASATRRFHPPTRRRLVFTNYCRAPARPRAAARRGPAPPTPRARLILRTRRVATPSRERLCCILSSNTTSRHTTRQ